MIKKEKNLSKSGQSKICVVTTTRRGEKKGLPDRTSIGEKPKTAEEKRTVANVGDFRGGDFGGVPGEGGGGEGTCGESETICKVGESSHSHECKKKARLLPASRAENARGHEIISSNDVWRIGAFLGQ